MLHPKEIFPIPLLLAAAWSLLVAPAAPQESRPSPAPVVVALALDTSGSVGQENLGRARTLALSILAALPPGSEVAVLTFDDRSRILVPRTSRPQEVKDRLKGVKVAGRYTALHDALYDASRYLRESSADRRAIVLITDGTDENSALNLDDGLKLAQEERIPVFTVGVGAIRERVLRRIAKLTGGDYLALREAKAQVIASKIGNLAPRQAAVVPAPAGTPLPPSPPSSISKAGPASPPPAQAPASTSGRKVLALGGLFLFLLAALALVLLKKSRPPAHACPSCGRELPGALARCPACGPSEAVTRSARRSAPDDEGMSPTVLARMNITEEFLEKTVTLRERPVLSITRGPGAGQVFDVRADSATSIGRAKANDIVVGDISVSTQHCRIRPEEGRFVLHDLKSTNGTFVNERKITRHVLTEGDVIKLGETSLLFRLDLKRD